MTKKPFPDSDLRVQTKGCILLALLSVGSVAILAAVVYLVIRVIRLAIG